MYVCLGGVGEAAAACGHFHPWKTSLPLWGRLAPHQPTPYTPSLSPDTYAEDEPEDPAATTSACFGDRWRLSIVFWLNYML